MTLATSSNHQVIIAIPKQIWKLKRNLKIKLFFKYFWFTNNIKIYFFSKSKRFRNCRIHFCGCQKSVRATFLLPRKKWVELNIFCTLFFFNECWKNCKCWELRHYNIYVNFSWQVQNVKTSRRTWLTIGGGLAGFLIGFILLLYIMHRHNVAQTKRAVKGKNTTAVSDKNATAILLSDAS